MIHLNRFSRILKHNTNVIKSKLNVRQRVLVLKELQTQHDELEDKYLHTKHLNMYQPLYAKRYKIVNGLTKVGVLSNFLESLGGEKGVPNFWLIAMKSNAVLADEITKSDEGALKYLKDIKWCTKAGVKGFTLEMLFNPNPYFKNSVLTKTYVMNNERDHIVDKAIGTKIKWFPGKKLTQKYLMNKPSKSVACDSFFNFFNQPEISYDENTAERIANFMERDYDIGLTIRDNIIPHAVYWFTGEFPTQPTRFGSSTAKATQNDKKYVKVDEEHDRGGGLIELLLWDKLFKGSDDKQEKHGDDHKHDDKEVVYRPTEVHGEEDDDDY